MSDRRLTPANGRVADIALKGAVEAENFTAGEPAEIAVFAAFLHAAPGGARDRQLMLGSPVTVYERRDGWAFLRVLKDGYVGYVEEAALGAPVAATHRVIRRQSHAYPAADLKQPPLARLPHAARLEVVGTHGRWAEIRLGGAAGFVPAAHLLPLEVAEEDPVAVAERFLGTPYLWAGNTGDGIDCSGLVQAACLACGIPCPGDSDLQAGATGSALPADAPLVRNDLVFWKGHVALVAGPDLILHANAHDMAVAFEPLGAAIARIEAQGDGPVTMRRRLPVAV